MQKSFKKRFVSNYLPPIIVAVAIFLIAEACNVWFGITSDLVLPSLRTVFVKLCNYFGTDTSDYLMTVKNMFIGYFCSIPIAFVFAALIAQSKLVIRATRPIIIALAMTPMMVLVYRVTVWMNYSNFARIVCVMLQVIPIITLNVLTGFTTVPREKEELALSYGASRAKRFFKIVVPRAMPSVFNGLRLGVMNSVLGVIATEMMIVSGGMGTRIVVACKYLQIPLVYGAIITVAVTGTILMAVVSAFEKRFVAWKG